MGRVGKGRAGVPEYLGPWRPSPTHREVKSSNTEFRGLLLRAGLCVTVIACDRFLKVSQGDWLRAQKQHNSVPGYQDTAGRAMSLSSFFSRRLPIRRLWASSYVIFFFLEGKQHELPKAADGSKFWVVKCQADGSEQLGIYGACRRGGENVPI